MKRRLRLRINKITLATVILDICVIVGLIVINTSSFKIFWIPTAMTTMSHKYLAYTLYSEDTVNKVMKENYIDQVNEEMNLDDIVIDGGKKKNAR